jgi:4-carboxymuconolactone decarboxylase
MDANSPDPRGLEMYERVLGRPFTAQLTGVREHTINHLFAEIWSRPQLSLRDRSLITIALLAAQGRADQLRDHIRGARSRGVPREDILEVMIHVAHYAGWAGGTSGQKIAEEVFAQETNSP